MKKMLVKIVVIVVMLSMGFLSYDNLIESSSSVVQLQKIERRLDSAKEFQAELQAEFPEMEIKSEGLEVLEAKKTVLEKEILKDKIEAGFLFIIIYGFFAFMGVAIVDDEMK